MFKEQVIVGTPGIVSEAVKRRCINPKMIVMLAVDEADHMLQENLGEQTSFIRSQLRPEAKVMLFSATFPDSVKEFADKIAPAARKITLKQSEVVLKRITQLTCRTDSEHSKFDIINAVFSSISIGQTIIFVNVCTLPTFSAATTTNSHKHVLFLWNTLINSQRRRAKS